MMSLILLWLAAVTPPVAEVRALSVMPATDRTEVVIQVAGDVTVKHFFLAQGNRLVLDLTGAKQGLRLDFSDIDRGGVRGMRIDQFKPQVVRVVVELARPVKYEVNRGTGEIRVSFPNPGSTFEPWSMGLNGVAASAPPVEAARTPVAPPVATRTTPAVTAPVRETRTPAQQQEAPLTFAFVDQPLTDVLAVFSEISGRSIVPAPEVVTKSVTAEIRDKPWDLALASILSAYGMVVTENEGGILIVESMAEVAKRTATEPVVTQEYRINFMSADSMIMTVQSLLTASGKVAVNPAGNSLLVTDTRSTVHRIGPIIRQLDVRQPQVSIAAKIVFVDRTALQELGFVYDLKDSRGNQLNRVIPGFLDANNNGIFEPDEQTDNNVVLLGGNSVAALANANYRLTTPALQVLTSLVMGRHSLFTFIEALSQVQVSDVQASPVVTTIANREARIQVGERTPIRVIDAGTGGGGGGGGGQAVARASVRLEQTGIILRVTPTITGNHVLLDIHAERSNIGLAPADIGAVFNTQEADTQVLVENGETAVIGGLTLIEKLKIRAGIPILMDIPIVGALFRQTSEREQKRDLLIMVTPHIIREPTQ
ncbi:MAG: AMIN domain-containing protein [Longimicrobiales bacterium]